MAFLDQLLDMEFLNGNHGYIMVQNFYPLSEDIKEGFYALE